MWKDVERSAIPTAVRDTLNLNVLQDRKIKERKERVMAIVKKIKKNIIMKKMNQEKIKMEAKDEKQNMSKLKTV